MFDAVIDARNGNQHAHPSDEATGHRQRLPGLRVLVVEDNLNNQQVACELLEGEGAEVQVANDGQEGIDAIGRANPPFDVVLMDLQMPVMDGLSAARHIRQNLGLHRLPIVAMTANAMASDRAECLAAGMNDHVGKPFDLDHLVGVLRKQTGQAVAGESPVTGPTLDLPDGVAAAALAAGVDLAGALKRLGGKLDVYQRLLRNFVTDLATMPEQLRHNATQADPVVTVRLLHTLKGLAATMGASTLAADAAHGERKMAGNTAPEIALAVAARACSAIDTALPGLTALMQTLTAAQEARDNGAQAPSTSEPDPAMLNALRSLVTQLEHDDMEAMQALAELRQAFGEALGEQLEPLETAMADLNFEQALPLCNALLASQTL
jgi:CheY-like chemotaxis protein